MKNSISANVWENKRSEISNLYKDEEWPLKQVIKKIRTPDFNPTETQLRSRLKKWGVTKPSRQKRRKPNTVREEPEKVEEAAPTPAQEEQTPSEPMMSPAQPSPVEQTNADSHADDWTFPMTTNQEYILRNSSLLAHGQIEAPYMLPNSGLITSSGDDNHPYAMGHSPYPNYGSPALPSPNLYPPSTTVPNDNMTPGHINQAVSAPYMQNQGTPHYPANFPLHFQAQGNQPQQPIQQTFGHSPPWNFAPPIEPNLPKNYYGSMDTPPPNHTDNALPIQEQDSAPHPCLQNILPTEPEFQQMASNIKPWRRATAMPSQTDVPGVARVDNRPSLRVHLDGKSKPTAPPHSQRWTTKPQMMHNPVHSAMASNNLPPNMTSASPGGAELDGWTFAKSDFTLMR